MTYDTVIRNGIVVDGTGLARRRADVGIAGGIVTEIGRVDVVGQARVIDASDLIVAPGIVDLHTHYDPQVTFDPAAQSSSLHGVTTVVAGNCGFSAAPCDVANRSYIARMFAAVEGMDPGVLETLPWDFETFGAYFDYLRGRLSVNVACYVGHSSVRRHVMGQAASEREATDDEVKKMCAVIADAMQSGAAGFSSSNGATQVDGDGCPVPSRFAADSELLELAEAAGRANVGTISYLPKGAVSGEFEGDVDLLLELCLRTRRPVIVQAIGGRSKVDAPNADSWEDVKRVFAQFASQGAALFSILRTQPFQRAFTLARGTSMYGGVPAWAEMLRLPIAEKMGRLRDPRMRAELRFAVENPNLDPAKGSNLPPPSWARVFVGAVEADEHRKLVGRSIAEIAEESRVAPADAMLDLALSENLLTEFRVQSDSEEWQESVAVAQRHPHMIVGVSDGGAHLDRDDGAEWSSYFLRHWVLTKELWTLEEGIRQLTQVPAALAGLRDRGTIAAGRPADLMLFDPAEVGTGTKTRVPVPGGGDRVVARPTGFHATIVNGEPIVLNGDLTSACPGTSVGPA